METEASTLPSLTSPRPSVPERRRSVGRALFVRPDRLGGRGVHAISASDRIDSFALPLQRTLAGLTRRPALRRVKDFLNGVWLGHPLHPVLTDIPIGAWTVSIVCDAFTVAGGRKYERAAETALGVGIVGAVASAVTGLADWTDTSTSQRRLGFAHAGLNTLALGLQTASFVCRRRKLGGARALSVIGYCAAGAAAYLGGSLVYDQGTMVRRTAHRGGPPTFKPALPESELQPGRPTRATVDGTDVVLVKHGGEIFALDDVCSHAGCPLSKGRLEGDAIVCACHGSTYRLRDGMALHGPAPFAQPTFDVRTENGMIAIRKRP